MRKYTLISLILTLLLCACTPSSGESGTTAVGEERKNISSEQYDRFRAGTYASFSETDDYYFWKALHGKKIHYYDKNSGASGFLCFKPECKHDDRSCDAFVGSNYIVGSLSVRDGMLYWIGYDVSIDPDVENYAIKANATFGVWRMKLDGREREFYGSLSYDEYVNYSYQRAYLWGDYYYFAGFQQVFQPGTTGSEPKISYSVSLTRAPVGGGAAELLQEITDIENCYPPMLLLDADAVYLFMGGWEENGDGSNTYNLNILKYHIAENRAEILLKNQEMKASTTEVRLYPEKGIIVTPGVFKATSENNPGDPLLYSLSERQLVPWLDFSESDYTRIWVMEEGLLLWRYERGESTQTRYEYELRDIEGNVVTSGILPLPLPIPEKMGFAYVAVWGSSREFFTEILNYETRDSYLIRYRVTPEGLQGTLLMQAEDEALTE